MKKIILIGRSEAGKTTLTQVLKGNKVQYHKTQYVNYHDIIIDTPGEYIQTKELGWALAIYSYEADVIGLLMSATEPFSLYSPNCVCPATRPVIGIVTKIDHEEANPDRAAEWLRLAGCKEIFFVSAKMNIGVDKLLEYLSE